MCPRIFSIRGYMGSNLFWLLKSPFSAPFSLQPIGLIYRFGIHCCQTDRYNRNWWTVYFFPYSDWYRIKILNSKLLVDLTPPSCGSWTRSRASATSSGTTTSGRSSKSSSYYSSRKILLHIKVFRKHFWFF